MNTQFTEMMKNLVEMQQKTFSMLTPDFKTTEYTNNYEEMLNNSIQFHRAASTYHNSIIEMMEAAKNSLKLFNPNQK